MSKSKLMLFLDGTGNITDTDKKREGRKSEGDKSTHNSMTGGSWAIDDDDLPEFYKLYCEHIRNHGPLHMTEKSTRIGALRVDLDFLYDGIQENHLHTRQQTIDFVKAWMNEFKKYIQIKDVIEVVVMEKTSPTIKGSRSKSGIHLLVPSIKSNRYIEEAVRRSLLQKMGKEFFTGLPLVEDWRKVYDPSPLTHTNNWTLLGSSKKEGTPYQIVYTIDWDSETGDVSIDENVPQATTPDLVRKLSVRSPPSEESPMTEEGQRLFSELSTNADEIRISGGRAVQPARGRPSTRDGTQSRGSSPDRIMYMQPLSEAMFKYYSAHVFNLGEFRYKTYQEWISVGICLKNIHPDLESVWLEFSSQDPNQYNPREAMSKWNSFSFRVDGHRLEEASLRKWSKMDNLDKYLEIEKLNINRLIEESAETGTEYDVAQVIHAMYRDEFKCARFGTSVWYRWCGHIWRETDRGVALQVLLSTEVRKEYLKKQIATLKMKEDVDTCQCGKETNPNCESCKLEDKAQRYASMQIKLKTTAFKEKVMKECRELFLDEDFINKLDENKRLIAFNNGVFDTLNMEFRDGRPDDYLSFSTNLDYDPDLPYHAHACWPEIDAFIRSVLPNPRVREYFMKHLATCLSGHNDAQKFHIMTGSGSNGKSMLSNLMTTTMGDYATGVSISLLTQKRGKSSAATPELIKIKGRRFVTMQEPDEEVPLNTGLMKELSSGEKVSARDLYQGSKQMVDFTIQARLHLSCNEKPKINTTDNGTWRRLVVVDFPMKFVEYTPVAANELPIDKTIASKVVSEEWARCFLSYLVHLYKEGNGFRKITPPNDVMAYTNEYKEDSDAIARFLREYIQTNNIEPGSSPDPVTKQMLTSSFQEWKRSNEIATRAPTTELIKRIESQYGKYPRFGWTSFQLGSS